jgi:rhodanese-related sulfurtransferase
MPIKTIDANTLKEWMGKGEAIVVDVREPAEHASSKIAGAKSIPLGNIAKSNLPEVHGSSKLVLHCQAGKRSKAACDKLMAEDPNIEIYDLEGGISAWANAGLSTLSSGRFFLPLDRQVQFAIGFMLVTASILGSVYSPSWFLLTGVIGLGLTIAGMTGFCGLARIIAIMPWNQRAK